MQVSIHQTLSSATVIAELAPSNYDNKANLAKNNGAHHEQVSTVPDEPNNLTKTNLARLIASCGDCV